MLRNYSLVSGRELLYLFYLSSPNLSLPLIWTSRTFLFPLQLFLLFLVFTYQKNLCHHIHISILYFSFLPHFKLQIYFNINYTLSISQYINEVHFFLLTGERLITFMFHNICVLLTDYLTAICSNKSLYLYSPNKNQSNFIRFSIKKLKHLNSQLQSIISTKIKFYIY